MRTTERVMGTVFVVETPEKTNEAVVDEVFRWFDWVERMFSVHRVDSEISRIDRGELDLDTCDPQVRGVLTRCEGLRERSGGAFEHRSAGRRLDPSAFVKGWSVDRAGLILRLAGVDTWRVNAGGDVLCSLRSSGSPSTRVGLRHPEHPHQIAAVLTIANGAVATSGEYERGAHMWGCHEGKTLRSVSVVGPELGVADALATALFVAGEPAPPWMDRFPGYGVLALTDEECIWTADLDGRLIAPSPRRRLQRRAESVGRGVP